MKFYLHLFRTIKSRLYVILATATITTVLINLWLINVPEIFSGGERLGVLVDRLAQSFISAFIFYFFVVHYKNQEDKLNLREYVSGGIRTIVNQYCLAPLDTLTSKSAVIFASRYPTEIELEMVMKGLNPNATAPFFLDFGKTKANWIQYLAYYAQSTKNVITDLYIKMPFLDSKLVDHLARINGCAHVQMIMLHPNGPLRNEDMAVWSSSYFKYIALVQELEQYATIKLGVDFK